MVLLKRKDDEVLIASLDNIIRYNTEKLSDVHIKIEKPTIPENLKSSQVEVINKEVRNITSIECSSLGDYLVIATENKQIIVYDGNFGIIKNIIANRAPSKACFTPSNDIIVADKTGDVFMYKLQDDENKPVLLLGHLSVILDLTISECGKYIITSDRDEKIRVSHFPNCYNIASYCLGHTEFVNRIKILKNVLLSASGDGTVRFWEFISGKQLGIIDTKTEISEKNLLQEFSDQMNKEKVDVSALPITDMQVHVEDVLYIAVSVYNYGFILLYSTNINSFSSQLTTRLQVDAPFSFCLGRELYIFNKNFSKYRLTDNNFVKLDDLALDKLCKKYSNVLYLDSNTVTVLYKRKYDNVQEYLERKKQRL